MEMLELTHHSFIAYTLPTTGKIVRCCRRPIQDRYEAAATSPETGRDAHRDHLPVRAGNAALPLVSAYNVFKQTWSAPKPFLLQRRYGSEDRPITCSFMRECMVTTSQAAQITIAGQARSLAPSG